MAKQVTKAAGAMSRPVMLKKIRAAFKTKSGMGYAIGMMGTNTCANIYWDSMLKSEVQHVFEAELSKRTDVQLSRIFSYTLSKK